MPDEPENLTLRLLQDIREEMRAGFTAMDGKLKDLTQRVNGITLMLSIVAGMTHEHEERIDKLEGR